VYRFFNQDRQFESRTLPWNPGDLAIKFPIELFDLRLPVGARGQSDGPVGMQVIDMGEWQECVQWCVDRSRDPIFAESRKWIVAAHLVFEFFAAIQTLELLQPIEIKKSKSRLGD